VNNITDLLKLKFLEGYRTYIGIGGLWALNIAAWNGYVAPGFTAMSPVDLLGATLIALGIYEKAKA
jgi:hypothetical protein